MDNVNATDIHGGDLWVQKSSWRILKNKLLTFNGKFCAFGKIGGFIYTILQTFTGFISFTFFFFFFAFYSLYSHVDFFWIFYILRICCCFLSSWSMAIVNGALECNKLTDDTITVTKWQVCNPAKWLQVNTDLLYWRFEVYVHYAALTGASAQGCSHSPFPSILIQYMYMH